MVMSGLSRIIINADDFGWSSAVNEAVLDAAENGVLSSATVMANMPGFEEAVREAKFLPKLGVGVHLNLLRGAPVRDPKTIKSLVGKDGRFLQDNSKLLLRFVMKQIYLEEVEEELSAQVKRVIDAGLKPTHIDSEKHMHILFPQLWHVVCKIALRFDVRRIRIAREFFIAGLSLKSPKQLAKALVVKYRCKGLAKVAFKHGLHSTDNFFGIALAGNMTTSVYKKLFGRLPKGTTEIMCHPGAKETTPGEIACSGWLDRGRVKEYLALVDPKTKEALMKSGAELINFGDI